MIKYPVWWDATITLYNRFEDPQTHVVSWYRHTIENCFWKDVGNKVTVGNTVLETDNIICRIPEQSNFLPQSEWLAKTADAKANFITLGAMDIIVYGAVEDAIAEYTDGHRSSDLLAKYKASGCMQVQRFGNNTGAGRGLPHYHVIGI